MTATDPATGRGRGLGDAAARGTGTTLLAQLVRAGLQFGSVVVLARLLLPEDFGLIAMVTSVIGIADLVRDFGLSTAAIQSRTLTDAEQTNLFWVNTALGAGCAGVALLCRPLIVSAYGEARIGPIISALACVFVLSGINTQFRTDLNRRMRFGALAVSDISAQVIGIVVAVSMALAGRGVWALVAQQIATALVSCAMNALSSPFKPGAPIRHTSIARFFAFGGGLLGTQAVSYVTKNIDNVALGAAAGAGPLGLYSRAYQLLMTPLNQINAPMTRVALPVLSAARNDQAVYERYLSKVQLVGCYLTATVFAVAVGLSGPLVEVLFGSRWHAVGPIFAVLAVGGVFRAVAQIAYWIYLSSGRPGAQLRMLLVTGPVMALIIVAGLPWGALGVACGHSVAYFLVWVVSLWHAGRVCGVDTRPLFRNALRAMLLVSAPAGAAAALANLLPWPALLQVLAGAGLAACCVGAISWGVPGVRSDAVVVLSFARRAMPGHRRVARP